ARHALRAPAVVPTIRSPTLVIGFANPTLAGKGCHDGLPPETVSTRSAAPRARRVGAPLTPPTMRSPAVVSGFANPGSTGRTAHVGAPATRVSTWPFVPVGTPPTTGPAAFSRSWLAVRAVRGATRIVSSAPKFPR